MSLMVFVATAKSSVEAHRPTSLGVMPPLTRVYERDVREPFTEWNAADESTGVVKSSKLVAGGTRTGRSPRGVGDLISFRNSKFPLSKGEMQSRKGELGHSWI
jgi:hypothetical protein